MVSWGCRCASCFMSYWYVLEVSLYIEEDTLGLCNFVLSLLISSGFSGQNSVPKVCIIVFLPSVYVEVVFYTDRSKISVRHDRFLLNHSFPKKKQDIASFFTDSQGLDGTDIFVPFR